MKQPHEGLQHGAELFDAGHYFEAHEAWEEAWRGLDRDSAASGLMRGLAQCAAAAIKLQQGKLSGARSLARKGAQLVASAAQAADLRSQGLDLVRFARDMQQAFEGDALDPTKLPRLLR